MPGNQDIQSVVKAINVLYAVASAEEGRTVAQLAGVSGGGRHATHRLVKTLEHSGLLQQTNGESRYIIGPAISELLRLHRERHLLAESGRILLEAQAKLPPASFSFLERDGTETFQRFSVEARKPGMILRRRHCVLHSYTKASSILFLAHAPPEAARLFFAAHPFEQEGKTIWGSMERLQIFMEQVRLLGYAKPDFPDENWFRLACPVFSRQEGLVAVIGGYVPIHSSDSVKRTLVRLTRVASRKISGILGG